jgi:hypothetical protein
MKIFLQRLIGAPIGLTAMDLLVVTVGFISSVSTF